MKKTYIREEKIGNNINVIKAMDEVDKQNRKLFSKKEIIKTIEDKLLLWDWDSEDCSMITKESYNDFKKELFGDEE